MHLVYSAFQQQPVKSTGRKKIIHANPPLNIARYLAHQLVCERYKEEIAAIQKYMPHWKPAWNVGR